ncbi:hypothetical protein AOLI_G00165780 [Acnodon oligacanthus]
MCVSEKRVFFSSHIRKTAVSHARPGIDVQGKKENENGGGDAEGGAAVGGAQMQNQTQKFIRLPLRSCPASMANMHWTRSRARFPEITKPQLLPAELRSQSHSAQLRSDDSNRERSVFTMRRTALCSADRDIRHR